MQGPLIYEIINRNENAAPGVQFLENVTASLDGNLFPVPTIFFNEGKHLRESSLFIRDLQNTPTAVDL